MLPKDEGEFNRRKDRPSGRQSRCRACLQEGNAAYLASRPADKCAEQAERKKRYQEANADKFKAYHQNYRRDHLPQKREWSRTRYRDNLNYKLSVRLRVRLSQALTGWIKGGSAVRDLGCTIPELKTWLEAQFYPHPETDRPMTWDDWSHDGWHIDHKRPLKEFDLTDREQFLQACHYTNLQPLWAEQNLAKGARMAA